MEVILKPWIHALYTVRIRWFSPPLQVPKIHADGVEATVCGVKTSRREISYVAPPPDTIFIQTDKPIYKPGQKGEQLVSIQFIIGLGACISSENQTLLMML